MKIKSSENLRLIFLSMHILIIDNVDRRIPNGSPAPVKLSFVTK